ncbi:MAG: HAMP domain-containing protein [Acidobacteria bacterium]|nr:HAMP domain-containing protein [Acidobacteriota bacterium]
MSSKSLSRVRRTITFRLILWYSAFFILGTAVLFVIAYVLLSSSVRQKDREEVHEKLGEYAAQYRAGGLEALGTEVTLEERSAKGEALFVRVAGPQNATLFLNTPERWREFDLAQLEGGRIDGQPVLLRTRNGKKALEVEAAPLADGLLLQVGRSTEETEDLLESFREIFTGIMVPVVVLGIAGGSFLAYRTLRPVRSLVQTVRSVSTGRMDARVPVKHTGDELDELALLFNAMLEKIEKLIEGMRGSLDTVAHDLRTPLTRLRGTAEVALRPGQNPEAYRGALADCVEEADELLVMLNTLMDISEAETGAMKLTLEEVSVPRLLEDTVELYAHVAEDKNVSLSIAPSEELTLTADRNRMRQVLANLLDNAIKYTPEGGRVDLRAFRQDGQAVITVSDSGAGVAPEDAPRIWERLYRGDPGRSLRGLGLGLSLVRAVVRAHQGRVEVSSAPGGGSLFTVYLPATPPQSR